MAERSSLLEACYSIDNTSIRHYIDDGFVIAKIFAEGETKRMAASSTDLDYCYVTDSRIALHSLMTAFVGARIIGTIEQAWFDPEDNPINDRSWAECEEAAEIDPSVRAGIATRVFDIENMNELEMYTTFAFADDGEVAVVRRWRPSPGIQSALLATATGARLLETDQIDEERIARFAMKHGYVVYEGAA